MNTDSKIDDRFRMLFASLHRTWLTFKDSKAKFDAGVKKLKATSTQYHEMKEEYSQVSAIIKMSRGDRQNVSGRIMLAEVDLALSTVRNQCDELLRSMQRARQELEWIYNTLAKHATVIGIDFDGYVKYMGIYESTAAMKAELARVVTA